MFKFVTVNCPLSNRVKTIIKFVLNLGAKSFKILTSTLIHGGGNFAWTIRILLESLQHVLKMYTWSLSENQASIQFRCRLVGLLLKQSLFRKHDFDIWVYRLYYDHQNVCLWHLNFFAKYRKGSHAHIREEHTEKLARYQFHGGGKALQFSSDELGGVGHCFTWHVWVSLCFYINFRIEKLVDNGLCAMWHLGHNIIFPAVRIKILPWKINRLLLYLWLLPDWR